MLSTRRKPKPRCRRPAQITHIADYSAAQGDTFDFTALTSKFHATGTDDNLIAHAVEDPSSTFAKLQVNVSDAHGMPEAAPIWADVAQIDGTHTGDTLEGVSRQPRDLAQIHVGLLA
jgi:hypothetical protein